MHHADGNRWRKYGQKVILSYANPKQRYYYRCSYPGCTAKKHMQWTLADKNKSDLVSEYSGEHSHGLEQNRSSITQEINPAVSSLLDLMPRSTIPGGPTFPSSKLDPDEMTPAELIKHATAVSELMKLQRVPSTVGA